MMNDPAAASTLTSSDLATGGMRWPRFLRVLVSPREVFTETLVRGTGYGALYGMLLIEFLLTRPLTVASHGMRLSFSPGAALSGLLTHYVNYALPTGVGIFVLGLVLYLALRRSKHRVELWTAASLLAYAWAPHVLLVALSVTVNQLFGVDHPMMPHHRFVQSGLGPLAGVGKVLLELTPSILLGTVAVRTVLCISPAGSSLAPPRRLWQVGGVAALILAAGFTGAGLRVWTDWHAVRPVMPGDALPAFALVGLDTPGIHHAQLHHQVVLLDFWATWCPPCVAAMPQIDQLQRDLGDRGFRVVSINAGDENPDTVRQFARERSLSFPIYIDRGDLRQRFQVDTFPTALLVDRHGTVRQVYIGDSSTNRIRNDIEALLEEPDRH
jgi:thiol-disulfide isomerase/thioredoxin